MNSPRRANYGFLCLGVALAGCATQGIRVEAHGGGPDPKAPPSYTLDLGATDAASRADPALAAAVTERLQRRGMVEAAGGRVLVEVAFTDRPLRVGDYVGVQAANNGRDWLTTPERPGLFTSPHARLCSLAVRMSVPATGAEIYRVRATVRPPRQGCGTAVRELAAAALDQIPLPPGR
jgi:hypothetical protein